MSTNSTEITESSTSENEVLSNKINKKTKRTYPKALPVIIILVIMLAVMPFTGYIVKPNAAGNYSKVSINVSRITQKGGGDCAIASISSVEATCYGLDGGTYTSSTYKSVYSLNGNTVYAYWSTLGYEKVTSFSLATIYNQLRTGYPVIIHKKSGSSSHYSVIYAYTGSSSSLEKSGFKVMEVWGSSNVYQSLSSWQGSWTLDHIIVRRNGAAVTSNGLNISCNHPYPSISQGKAFNIYGKIISKSKLTSVKIKITDKNGDVAKNSTYSKNPNAKSFTVSNANSSMAFSKLSKGTYTYSVYAKNADGTSKTFKYNFTVTAAPATTTATTKTVSYKATVTASSLILRKGAGTSYQKLTSIPKGKSVTVSAESGNWGKVTYSGYTGWCCLDYLKKVSATTTKATTKTTAAFKTYKAKVTASSLILRKGAGTSYKKLTSIPKGTVVTVKAKSGNWGKVTYKGYTGWCCLDYLKKC